MAIYTIDTAHSEINFKVKHLMITHVTGGFQEFEGTMTSEKDDFTDASIVFEAAVDSIDTNNEQRDAHLKAADFFAAGQYPRLRFQSTVMRKTAEHAYELEGQLTIRDSTQPVALTVAYGGMVVDAWGQTKIGFEIKGTINRKQFGLVWSEVTETGGIVLADEVKLELNVQLIRQA